MNTLCLTGRNIIRISGGEAEHFLQGLITGDIHKVTAEAALYAALLTAQGKYLFDFFILRDNGGYLFDVEAARKDDLIKKITFYKLRADVVIEDLSDSFEVWAFWPGLPKATDAPNRPGRFVYPDPRSSDMGWRGLIPKGSGLKETATFGDYEDLRLTLGLPDGSRDIEVDKRFILEANFAELNGVDFNKGCYVGQEMTARMTYRGSLKKRLLPVTVAGLLPAPGGKILCAGKEAGHFQSGLGNKAIALLRLEYLDQPLATEDGDTVTVIRPDWLKEV